MNETYADLAVYGKAYTAEKENDVCDAIAIKDGKFIYAGDKQGVIRFIKEGVTKIIDNNDGLIIPSCTEAHAHFVGVDALVRMFPGFYKNYEELLVIIKENIEFVETNGFFLSFGMDYLAFADVMDPEKSYAQELEDIAPGKPIILLDNGGHQALCNVTALEKAGVYNGKSVRGGEILKTKSGIPNGVVTDEVVLYVLERAIDFSKLDPEILIQSCRNAIDTLHKRGFTNFYDAYINYLAGIEYYKYLKALDEKDELNINVTTTYTIRSYEADEYKKKIDFIREMGDKYRTKHFNPYHVKLFADGVVEGKTGWMIEPYPNPVNGRDHGNIIWKPEELKQIVLYANSKGSPVHTHTFGDGACKAVLDAYVYAQENCDKKPFNTLAHVRNIRKEDIDRCAKYNIGIAENLIWHTDNTPNDDSFEKAFDIKKAFLQKGVFESGYPMKSLVDAGISVSSSTDAPAAELIEGNILNIIEVSTTGIAPGYDFRPYNASELLTVRQVLDCLTINGARQLGIEDITGSIKVGKNADFVMLDKNFLDYKGEDLKKIHYTKINSVYFEGKEVYSN